MYFRRIQNNFINKLEAIFWVTVFVLLYFLLRWPLDNHHGSTLVLYQSLVHGTATWLWPCIAGLLILCFISLFLAYRYGKEVLAISDTPLSTISSAAQGYVALKGHGSTEADNPIYSPLTKTQCIWYSFKVEKRSMLNRRNDWVIIKSGTCNDLFWLEDGVAKVLVDPDEAQVFNKRIRVWTGSTEDPEDSIDEPDVPKLTKSFLALFSAFDTYRYTESIILVEDLLYITGNYGTQRNNASFYQTNSSLNTDHQSAVTALLRDWQSNYPALLAKFDLDKDGELNEVEYDQVVKAAENEITSQSLTKPAPPQDKSWRAVNVISKQQTTEDSPFIISTINLKVLTHTLKFVSAGYFLVFIFLFTLALGFVLFYAEYIRLLL